MTQKNQHDGSSDSEDEEMVATVEDNPWFGGSEKVDELDEIFSGYRKIWEEQNEVEKDRKSVE